MSAVLNMRKSCDFYPLDVSAILQRKYTISSITGASIGDNKAEVLGSGVTAQKAQNCMLIMCQKKMLQEG